MAVLSTAGQTHGLAGRAVTQGIRSGIVQAAACVCWHAVPSNPVFATLTLTHHSCEGRCPGQFHACDYINHLRANGIWIDSQAGEVTAGCWGSTHICAHCARLQHLFGHRRIVKMASFTANRVQQTVAQDRKAARPAAVPAAVVRSAAIAAPAAGVASNVVSILRRTLHCH